MNEETFKAKKRFAGEKKPSMRRRCVTHDYLSPNIYMITMTTTGRQPWFGKVVGNTKAAPESPEYPHIFLSPLGSAVFHEWMGIYRYYPQIRSLFIQVMPDHIHGILQVMEPIPVHLGQVMSGFKAGCNRAFRQLVLHEEQEGKTGGDDDTGEAEANPTEAHAAAIASSIRSASSASLTAASVSLPAASSASVQYASASSKPHPQKRPKHPSSRSALLFEKGYHDGILYGKGQLDRWFKYLKDNPYRLMLKREHPDLFRVQMNLKFGIYTFSAIGNRFLLDRPYKLQLQCSRKLTDEQIKEKKQTFLKEAAKGAVTVSPSISKGEKEIMRAVFDAGHPIILLQENGFTYLSKPSGTEYMNACAEGRLLILAPWEHHNERRTITRQQCQSLNAYAAYIVAK